MVSQVINKGSIEGILQGKEFSRLEKAIEQEKEEPEKLRSSKDYFLVIREHSEGVIVESTQNKDLGHCRLKLIVAEGLPKKVCFLRNGMLITDKLHGLMRFYNYKDFVAVFECLDEKGNALLREMEPPKHDDFEPERLTKEQQAKGKRALKNIKEWIKSMIKRHAQDPVEDESSLDELAQFIGTESSESGDSKNEEVNPIGKIQITAKPVKRKSISAPFISSNDGQGEGAGEEDGSGDFGNRGGNSGDGSGDGTGLGEGSGTSAGKENAHPVALKNVRIISSGKSSTKVFFTPSKSGNIRVRLFLAGADSDYPTNIISSSVGIVKEGAIFLESVSDERISAEIEIKESSQFAIKVVADEI